MSNETTRRDFLVTSAVAGAAAAVDLGLLGNVHATQNNEAIRVGLVGCGGRGSGAIEHCLRADANVTLVAVADAFRDRANSCLTGLRRIEAVRNKVNVPNDRIFIGLEAYQQRAQADPSALLNKIGAV